MFNYYTTFQDFFLLCNADDRGKKERNKTSKQQKQQQKALMKINSTEDWKMKP